MTISWWQTLSCVPLLLLSTACETAPPPIDVRAIGKVQGEIKRQIGVYLQASSTADSQLGAPGVLSTSGGETDKFWCGTGNVDYDISSVTAELTTSVVSEAKLSATLAPDSVVAPTGTFSFGRSVSNSQALSYSLWPLGAASQGQDFRTSTASDEAIASAPIARVLLDLRRAQLEGAMKRDPRTGVLRPPQPCFSNYDPAKPASDSVNTYRIGLVITKTGGVELGIGTVPLKVGASLSNTVATGHSLTVSFAQRGMGVLHAVRQHVEKLCEYPKGLSKDCREAAEAFERFRIHGDIEHATLTKLAPQGAPLMDLKRSVGLTNEPGQGNPGGRGIFTPDR